MAGLSSCRRSTGSLKRTDSGSLLPRLVPDAPRWIAGVPHRLQDHLVAERIHVLPKASMPVHRELVALRQRAQRALLPNGVISPYNVEHFRLEDEETTINYRAVRHPFLAET